MNTDLVLIIEDDATLSEVLRDKIEEDPHHPRFIRTIRDIGYRFEPSEPAPTNG